MTKVAISVLSDQRRTKSTIWSRMSWGTQHPFKVPQVLFLAGHALPAVRPARRLFVGAWPGTVRSSDREHRPSLSVLTPLFLSDQSFDQAVIAGHQMSIDRLRHGFPDIVDECSLHDAIDGTADELREQGGR